MKKQIYLIPITFLLALINYQAHSQNTILWEITDTINKKTSVILGSFHQYGNSFIDSIPIIADYLNSSEIAIFEALNDNGKTINMINDRKDTDIKRYIRKKTYYQLLDLSKEWDVNLNKLRPIELSWKLEQEYVKNKCNTVKKSDNWDHMDSYIEFLADEKGIPVSSFETYEEQVELISENYQTPNWKKQNKRIKYLTNLHLSPKINQEKCANAKNYKSFKIPYQFDIECPSNILIKKRNAEWMIKLGDLTRNHKCFIVVGYDHLRWKCGLLEQLKQQGLIVKPLNIK
ncbi:MAG: TraB/GumN family protein [Crocinitomicaceae bacterium]|nr:TraB/GumN family protein [Crocinitomicaceae bacterium]